MLQSDIKLVTPIAGWRAGDRLRINSGVHFERRTRWAEVAETFARYKPNAARQPDIAPPPNGGRIANPNPRFSNPAFLAVRALSPAYPPKSDWRPLRDDELDKIWGITGKTALHSTVQVMEVPERLIAAFRRAAEPHIAAGKYEFNDGLMDIPATAFLDAIADMDAWLAQAFFSHAGWLMVNMRPGMPGRVMSSGFQGLHIDLYGPAVQTQMTSNYSGSRLAINLTGETRYVGFINLKLATMAERFPAMFEILDAHGARDAVMSEAGAQTLFAAAFMETFPDYPVIRLALEPGEAYMAPTTIFPHEGLLTGRPVMDNVMLASHKGFDGASWIAPDYNKDWTKACMDAARRFEPALHA